MTEQRVERWLWRLEKNPRDTSAVDALTEQLMQGALEQNTLRQLEMARGQHAQRGEFPAVAALIEVESVALADDRDFVRALRKELARLKSEELLDDVAAFQILEELGGPESEDPQVATSYRVLAEDRENWRDAAERYAAEGRDTADARLITRAASLLWQHGGSEVHEEADALFQEALKMSPGYTRAARQYALTLSERERWQDAAAILRRAAQVATERDTKTGLWLELGRIYDEQLSDSQEAIEAYRAALALAPDHHAPMNYLEAQLSETQDWHTLADVYEQALRRQHSVEREAELLSKLGTLHWKRTQDLELAERFFVRLRKIQPADENALAFFRETRNASDETWLDILADAQRASLDEGQRLSLATELAKSSEQSERWERAIQAWGIVKQLDPGSSEAANALEELYRKAGKWNAVAQGARDRINSLPEDAIEKRIESLKELVVIYRDQMKLPAMVIQTYEEILELDPKDQTALDALANQYEASGRWNDLIGILEKQVEMSESTEEQAALLRRAAGLWNDRFANEGQASQLLERVLSLVPEDAAAQHDLREIYMRRRNWEGVYRVLQHKLERASTPSETRTLQEEIAEICSERLRRGEEAISIWKQILREDEKDPDALSQIEKLATREQDWDTLAFAIEKGLETEGVNAPEYLQRLAILYGERLDEADKATQAWARLLEINPRHPGALRALRSHYREIQDWNAVEALYQEQDDWDGFAEFLRQSANDEQDPAIQVELILREASVSKERLNAPLRERRAYERVLEIDRDQQEAAEFLLPVYQAEKNWQKVASTLAALLRNLPASAARDERIELLTQLRDTSSERLKEASEAFEWSAQIFALDPTDQNNFEALEKLALQSSKQDEFLALLQARAEDPESNDEERTFLRRMIATSAAGSLNDPEMATTQFEALFEQGTASADDIEKLASLYHTQERFEALKDLRERELVTERDAARKGRLMRELAELCATYLKQPEQALRWYQEALKQSPSDVQLLQAADQAAAQCQSWKELESILGRRLELTGSNAETLEIALRLADLRRVHLNEISGSLDAYQRALNLDPANSIALAGLEALLDTKHEQGERVATLLLDSYRSSHQPAKIAALLQRQIKDTQDPEVQKALRLQLAEVSAAELDDQDSAYAILESTFFEDPNDPQIFAQLSATATRLGKEEALCEAVANAIKANNIQHERRTELTKYVATFLDDRLQRPEAAEPYYRQLLEWDPLDREVFACLKHLLTKQERWQDLDQLYALRIEAGIPDAEQLELLQQRAFVLEEMLQDAGQAIPVYEAILQIDAHDLPARRALERLYRSEKQWQKLAKILRESLSQATRLEATEISFELAQVYEEKLTEPEEAITYYESVLSDNPTHIQAQEGLTRFLSHPDLRVRAAETLAPLYESQGVWDALTTTLEVQLEDTDNHSTRDALSIRLAELYENKLNDADRAFEMLAATLSNNPADAHIRLEFARLAGRCKRQQDRAVILESALSNAEGRNYTELLWELVEIRDNEQEDYARAEVLYRELLEREADAPDRSLRCLRALARIYESQNDLESLAQTLERTLDFETDSTSQADLSRRLIALYDGPLEQADAAIRHLERLRQHEIGGGPEVATQLAKLYRQEQRWLDLCNLLASEQHAASNPKQAHSLALERAGILAREIKDDERAIDAYEGAAREFGYDTEILDALQAIYERGKQWPELLEVYSKRIELSADPEQWAHWQYTAAELQRTQLDDIEAATDRLLELLEAQPDHEEAIGSLHRIVSGEHPHARLRAARALRPLYRQRQAWGLLDESNRVLVESDDIEERIEVLRESAAIAQDQNDDPAAAFALQKNAAKAAVDSPTLEAVIAELEDRAERAQNYTELANTLAEIAYQVSAPAVSRQLHWRTAVLSRGPLSDPDLARAQYQALLDIDHDDSDALNALIDLESEQKNHAPLVDLLERKLDFVESPTERTTVLSKIARTYESGLAQTDLAIDTYERIVRENPDPDAFEHLDRLYRAQERWEDVVALYENQLGALPSPGADLSFEVAGICLNKLNDKQGAIAALSQTLQLDPHHERALGLLHELMDDPHAGAQAAEALEPVYLGRMEWNEVIDILKRRLAGTEDVYDQSALLRRIGDIQESHLEDLEGALDTYGELLTLNPRDETSRELLFRLGRAMKAWEKLAGYLDRALSANELDDAETASVAKLAAQIFEERLQHDERAQHYYERALRFDPSDNDAASALMNIYTRTEAWQPLQDLYRDRLNFADTDEAQISLLHRLGELARFRFDDSGGAIETYREILQLDPTDKRATDILEALFEDTENWGDLSDHLEARLHRVTMLGERHAIAHRLAQVIDREFHDRQRAIEIYEAILEEDPHHLPTLEALEAFITDETYALDIARLLEPIYAHMGAWDRRVRVLEAQADRVDSVEERIALLKEIALVQERMGADQRAAFRAWGRAMVLDPHDESTREQVDRLAEILEDWGAWIEIYESTAAETSDIALRTQLLLDVGHAKDLKLGDPRAAIVTFRRILDEDPSHEPALLALDSLQTLVGDWAGLIEVLNFRLDAEIEPQMRAALFKRTGSIYEDLLNEPAKAREAYENALAEGAQDPETLDALDRIYLDAGEPERIADILHRRLELEDQDKPSVAIRLAEIYHTQLGQTERATDIVREYIPDAETHPQAGALLADLLEHQGRWEELITLLHARVALASSPAAQSSLLSRIGLLYEQKLDVPEQSIQAFGNALTLDPNEEHAIEGLLRAARLGEHCAEAASLLTPPLEQTQRWPELSQLIRLQLDHTTEGGTRIAHLERLAEVEANAGNAEQAFEAELLAFEEDPARQELWAKLSDRAARAEGWSKLAERIGHHAQSGLESEAQRALYEWLARISESELADDQSAIHAYQQALQHAQDQVPILEALDRLYVKAQQWGALQAILQRRIAESDSSGSLELWLRLGDLRLTELQELGGALEAYRTASELAPNDQQALEGLNKLIREPSVASDATAALEHAYQEASLFVEMRALYNELAAQESDALQSSQWLKKSADISETRLGDLANALESLITAFQKTPENDELLSHIERLSAATQNWLPLRGIAENVVASRTLGDAECYALLLRAAGWYQDNLDDPAAAEGLLRQAIEIDTRQQDAHQRLVDLLRGEQRIEEMTHALIAWARNSESDAARIEHWTKAAHAARNELHEPELAAECFEALAELQPGQAEPISAIYEIRHEQGRWSDAAVILRQLINLESDQTQKTKDLIELAKLFESKLEDPESAVSTFEEALELAPQQPELRENLGRLYAQIGDYEKLAASFQDALQSTQDPRERLELHDKLAALYEAELADADEAVAHLVQALDIAPEDEALGERLEALYRGSETWDELVALLDKRVARSLERELAHKAIQQLEEMAGLHQHQRGDAEATVQCYQRVLQIDPRHEVALRHIAQISEEQGEWPQVVESLEQLLALVPAAEAQTITLRATKIAQERLEDSTRVESLLVQGLERAPESTQLRDELRQHYLGTENYAALATTLESDLERADDAEKRDILGQLWKLYQNQLSDPSQALRHLQHAYDLEPDNSELRISLCDLYLETGQHSAAIPLLQQIVESAENQRDKSLAPYLHRLGQALEAAGNQEEALERYEAAFKLDLGNVSILRDLGKLSYQRGNLERAQKAFRGLLLQKIEADAEITKADVYYYLGDIAARLDDAKRAQSMLERALAENPQHELAAGRLASIKAG